MALGSRSRARHRVPFERSVRVSGGLQKQRHRGAVHRPARSALFPDRRPGERHGLPMGARATVALIHAGRESVSRPLVSERNVLLGIPQSRHDRSGESGAARSRRHLRQRLHGARRDRRVAAGRPGARRGRPLRLFQHRSHRRSGYDHERPVRRVRVHDDRHGFHAGRLARLRVRAATGQHLRLRLQRGVPDRFRVGKLPERRCRKAAPRAPSRARERARPDHDACCGSPRYFHRAHGGGILRGDRIDDADGRNRRRRCRVGPLEARGRDGHANRCGVGDRTPRLSAHVHRRRV